MRLEGRGERLTIFVGETDQHRHRPLYTEIVERAHEAGLAGATVLRGIEGYGASSHIHTTAILRLSEDLPVVIVIVDTSDRIDAFLARLADGRKIRFVNVNDKLADENGRLRDGMTIDGLHPTLKGYQIWADALKPIFTEILGPPAATDMAPPPTGDPAARGRAMR